eukprot:TRINITY_DN6976_c0_g1_i6.p1 TRINITY_DN6976_c0_g1~~TRINITY_DN6976_c0_g1_i6.p1  ORF type:complete len:311 (-),score=75.50 TRINITY_DN6976_c0_g1_i6:193-1125(-)
MEACIEVSCYYGERAVQYVKGHPVPAAMVLVFVSLLSFCLLGSSGGSVVVIPPSGAAPGQPLQRSLQKSVPAKTRPPTTTPVEQTQAEFYAATMRSESALQEASDGADSGSENPIEDGNHNAKDSAGYTADAAKSPGADSASDDRESALDGSSDAVEGLPAAPGDELVGSEAEADAAKSPGADSASDDRESALDGSSDAVERLPAAPGDELVGSEAEEKQGALLDATDAAQDESGAGSDGGDAGSAGYGQGAQTASGSEAAVAPGEEDVPATEDSTTSTLLRRVSVLQRCLHHGRRVCDKTSQPQKALRP